jgi:hypothetical protein
MLLRSARVLAAARVLGAYTLVAVATAPWALADPDPNPAPADADTAAPPGDDGQVASAAPATTTTPDGWVLTVTATDESQLPVAPLTTASTSRDFIVGGTFHGSLKRPDKAGDGQGTLEVGYQIACAGETGGIDWSGQVGLLPGAGALVRHKPGTVYNVMLGKKEFKGTDPWVMISGARVKIDGCLDESFIRSYATLTRSTDVSDASLSYYGVTKVVSD